MANAECEMTKDHRTTVKIAPWAGSESVKLCITAGKKGHVLDEPAAPGCHRVELDYPNHKVTAEVPDTVLKMS